MASDQCLRCTERVDSASTRIALERRARNAIVRDEVIPTGDSKGTAEGGRLARLVPENATDFKATDE